MALSECGSGSGPWSPYPGHFSRVASGSASLRLPSIHPPSTATRQVPIANCSPAGTGTGMHSIGDPEDPARFRHSCFCCCTMSMILDMPSFLPDSDPFTVFHRAGMRFCTAEKKERLQETLAKQRCAYACRHDITFQVPLTLYLDEGCTIVDSNWRLDLACQH